MLLKGCQRKIICMRPANSHLFDEAFFILREEAAPAGERDMLQEANRILEENMFSHRRTARTNRQTRLSICFFAFGAAAASLLWFLGGVLFFF